MPTTNQGASYVQLPNGEYVSAGLAKSVAARVRPELQQVVPQTLDCHASRQTKSKKGAIVCHVLIIRIGSRLLDDDNLAASYKALRDDLAAELGIDDGDARIKFDYDQIQTTGATGTHVLISQR